MHTNLSAELEKKVKAIEVTLKKQNENAVYKQNQFETEILGRFDHSKRETFQSIEKQTEAVLSSLVTKIDFIDQTYTGVASSLQTKFIKLEKSYAEAVQNMEEQSKNLSSTLTTKLASMDQSYSTVVKDIETHSRTLASAVKRNEIKDEQLERDARSKNLIIFGIPDDASKASTLSELNKLLQECHLPKAHEDSCHRIGHKVENKVRPLRLSTCSASKKWDILKRINALRKRGVFARLDLNKEERESDFRLRQQLIQARNQSPDKTFKIKNREIVEIKLRNSEQS